MATKEQEKMEWFKVEGEGNWYTIYTAKGNQYFRQHFNYWEKGGYTVPQTVKKITEKEYMRIKRLVEGRE